eukprot:m.342240 g.342240  ORF g.342240 m.342240 type:complete len:962 (-) comp21136_c0_seq1:76-2961(-)
MVVTFALIAVFISTASGFRHAENHEPQVAAIVTALLSKMTPEEKARQLTIFSGVDCCITNGIFDEKKAATYFGTVGAGVLDSYGRNTDPILANKIQRAAVKASRFGIGAIIAEECQHGVQGDWHTMFPSPYTMAAAFDKDLMQQIGEVIGTEARAGSIHECWSPVCGLAREPRWGRSEEEMSEDPFLAGELVEAMVKGMNGVSRGANLSSSNTVAPKLKHYAAYSIPENGANTAPTPIGRRVLQEIFLPPFEKAIRAGAQGIMSSYNEIDGVPTSSDSWLLTEQLRDTFKFQGYVCADFGAIERLGPSTHYVAFNDSDCVRQFLEAGGSVNGHDFEGSYESIIVNLTRSGVLSEETLDASAGAVLAVKVRLGLAKHPTQREGDLPYNPYVNESLVQHYLGDNPQHIAIAEKITQESVVLLENKNKTLPFNPSKIKKLLVVGPNADEARAGDYSAAGWAGGAPNGGGNINNKNTVTILEGLKQEFPDADVSYIVGAGILSGIDYWTAVQRHSLSVSEEFEPTAPSVPYKKAPEYKVVKQGMQGLKAEYFANTDFKGVPMTRLDYAPNFHYIDLGPDPIRLPNGTFSVRWTGLLTPDSSVKGAKLQCNTCQGHFCTPTGSKQANCTITLDGSKYTPGTKFDLERGHSVKIQIEYWQQSSQSSSVFLQWCLLPDIPNNVNSNATIQQAVDLVADTDAIVIVVGGANNDGTSSTEGEGLDRASLALDGDQLALIHAVSKAAKEANKLTVTVLVDGKPTSEPSLTQLPAVIAAFQGGQAGGTAVARVISGSYNPSGKLPVSFPVSSEVLPVYYNYKPSAKRSHIYLDFKDSIVIWPFGHGLSYTTFALGNLDVPATPVPKTGGVNISCTVTNHGDVDGETVVQLYLRHVGAPVTMPVKMLKGFVRVHIASGATATIAFPTVNVERELSFVNRQYQRELPAGGQFLVSVGLSSDDPSPLTGKFTISV